MHLGLVDVNKIQSFYETYIEITGNSLGWESPISAVTIYDEASNFPNQCWGNIDSLLDVGSGEGHFIEFLRNYHNYEGSYLGVEILPMFNEVAEKNYGGQESVEFIQADFLQHDFKDAQFDWVVSLGSLSVKQERQAIHDRAMCKKMMQLARKGISIYINDPKNTPPGQRRNVPGLAWHDTHKFVDMLKYLGALDVCVVHFPVNPTSKGTMLHIIML